MRLVPRLWVFALFVFPIEGCNEVTDPTTAPLTLGVVGKDTEDGPLVALEGAQLCETGTENCRFSDASGRVAIELPIGEESSYTLAKEGYASYLVPHVMLATGYPAGTWEMASNRLMVARHEGVSAPYPMIGTGSILVGLSQPFAGATFDLVDATGSAFYWEEEGNWNPDLKETTSVGWGGFVEVPPGVRFQVELGGTAENCAPGWAWPGDKDTFWFPVRENHLTVVTVTCAQP